MTEKDLPKGFTCFCGVFYKYPAYVYAHWKDELVFTCPDCHNKYLIIEGIAEGEVEVDE